MEKDFRSFCATLNINTCTFEDPHAKQKLSNLDKHLKKFIDIFNELNNSTGAGQQCIIGSKPEKSMRKKCCKLTDETDWKGDTFDWQGANGKEGIIQYENNKRKRYSRMSNIRI